MDIKSALPPTTSLEGNEHNQGEIPVLTTIGEYKIYPMEICSEDQVAVLFSKICQRGNPLLQGRPAADLTLLGRAMYRKAMTLRLGQVALHKDQPVAIGVSWDVADGGVWKGSGLEVPTSLAAHAACGKAVFDSLQMRGDTFFGGFFGVLPPHDGVLFGFLGVSCYLMANILGYQDVFQYTPLPTLTKREGGVFSKKAEDSDDENKNWHMTFTEVAAGAAGVAADELREMEGTISINRSSMSFVMGEEWMSRAAWTVKLPSAQAMRGPAQEMATNHVHWLKRQANRSLDVIPSRL